VASSASASVGRSAKNSSSSESSSKSPCDGAGSCGGGGVGAVVVVARRYTVREHGVGCEEAVRHFLPAIRGCEPNSEASSML
jgi:hypothetical protein